MASVTQKEHLKELLKPKGICHQRELLTKLKQFRADNLKWIERLDLVSQTPSQIDDDTVDHDFKREDYFMKRAASSVEQGIKRLRALKVKIFRPNDYIAEMAKSDNQMDKVKRRLDQQQEVVERQEKARKLRNERAMAKQKQAETKLAKQQEKKEFNEHVKKFRKGKTKSLDFIEDDKNNKNDKKTRRPPPKVSKKAELKSKKYGYGGRKKRAKYNTKESAGDLSGWRFGRDGGANKLKSKKPDTERQGFGQKRGRRLSRK